MTATTTTISELMQDIGRKTAPQARIHIVVPQELHRRVKIAASARSMSMNAFLVELLDRILPNADGSSVSN